MLSIVMLLALVGLVGVGASILDRAEDDVVDESKRPRAESHNSHLTIEGWFK